MVHPLQRPIGPEPPTPAVRVNGRSPLALGVIPQVIHNMLICQQDFYLQARNTL